MAPAQRSAMDDLGSEKFSASLGLEERGPGGAHDDGVADRLIHSK